MKKYFKSIKKEDDFIRVMISNDNHWVCVAGGLYVENEDVCLYDSSPRNGIDSVLGKNLANVVSDRVKSRGVIRVRLQNTQKQHDFDLASTKKSTKKGVATTMATFVNTFNLAFSYIPNINDEKIQKFINTLKASFDKSISDIKVHNIEFLIPKTGDIFDPNFMEILNPDSVQGEEVQVKQVVSVGIKVDNQLIQAASIMV